MRRLEYQPIGLRVFARAGAAPRQGFCRFHERSTLILGAVGGAAKIGKLTVRAIRRDKAEVAVLPGPGKLLRGLMDRVPGLGPAMNRVSSTNKTMPTVAEYREREARLASAERGPREGRPTTRHHHEEA